MQLLSSVYWLKKQTCKQQKSKKMHVSREVAKGLLSSHFIGNCAVARAALSDAVGLAPGGLLPL
jgi:hypothetical protein